MTATQLELFPDGCPKVSVKLYQLGDAWHASVNGGWFIATGKTERAALIAVAKRIEAELNIKIDVLKNL